MARLGDFTSSWQQIFSQSSQNILVTFWAISNNVTIMKMWVATFWAIFEEK